MTPVEEVQAAVENLIRVATRHEIAVVGFVFEPKMPLVMNFGNSKDYQKIELYEVLVKLCNLNRTRGLATEVDVKEVN